MSDTVNLWQKEGRARDLEAIIRKDSRITVKDRLGNVWQNLKANSPFLIGSALTMAFAGATAYSIFECVKYNKLIQPFEHAEKYLSSLQKIFLMHANVEGAQMPLSDAFQPAITAINEGAKNYDSAAVQNLAELVNANSDVYKHLNKENFLGTAQPVLDALHKVTACTSKIVYSCIAAGGVLGTLVSLLLSVNALFNSQGWVDKLQEKRARQRIFDADLPQVIEGINNHPFADEIYGFAGWASGQAGMTGINLYNTLQEVMPFRGEQYAPVFRKLATKSDIPVTSTSIANLFTEFITAQHQLDEQKERDITKEKEALARNERVKNYEAIRSLLIDQQWNVCTADGLAHNIANEDAGAREFWIELLKKAGNRSSMFMDLYHFYKIGQLEHNKKKRIVEHLVKDNNDQVASQLAGLPLHTSKKVMDYISGLDEVAAIGIKGQINSLLKIDSLYSILADCSSMHSGIVGLEELLQFKAPKIDESIIEITRFLEEHSDIPAGQAIPLLLEYYHFSDGQVYQSSRLKKGDGLEQSAPKSRIDAKNAKKFLQELKTKAELAKYSAFNRFIDNSVVIPLRDILGEKLEGIIIKNTEEIMHVIRRLKRMEYSHAVIVAELKELLKAYLPAPDKIQCYLDGLNGNKNLESRLAHIGAWKLGMTKTYTLQKEGDNKKLRKQIEHEYSQLRKNFKVMGVELPASFDYSAPEQNSQIAEESLSRIAKTISGAEENHHFKRAHKHLERITERLRVIQSAGKFTFYDAKDPIEAMQMGIVTGSCTSLKSGVYAFSSFVNAIDANKKVVYMANESGKKIGRTLAVLTNSGIVTFRKYDSSSLDTDNIWLDYFSSYAKQVGVPLILPDKFLSKPLHKQLKAKGFRPRLINVLLHKAVCSEWYDDAHAEAVHIEQMGYPMELYAFVVT